MLRLCGIQRAVAVAGGVADLTVSFRPARLLKVKVWQAWALKDQEGVGEQMGGVRDILPLARRMSVKGRSTRRSRRSWHQRGEEGAEQGSYCVARAGRGSRESE